MSKEREMPLYETHNAFCAYCGFHCQGFEPVAILTWEPDTLFSVSAFGKKKIVHLLPFRLTLGLCAVCSAPLQQCKPEEMTAIMDQMYPTCKNRASAAVYQYANRLIDSAKFTVDDSGDLVS